MATEECKTCAKLSLSQCPDRHDCLAHEHKHYQAVAADHQPTASETITDMLISQRNEALGKMIDGSWLTALDGVTELILRYTKGVGYEYSKDGGSSWLIIEDINAFINFAEYVPSMSLLDVWKHIEFGGSVIDTNGCILCLYTGTMPNGIKQYSLRKTNESGKVISEFIFYSRGHGACAFSELTPAGSGHCIKGMSIGN